MSSTTAPTACWPSDLTRVCERLAQHLDRSGATHPVAAAVTLAARGHQGLDVAEFADVLGLPVDAIRRAEAGNIAWEDEDRLRTQIVVLGPKRSPERGRDPENVEKLR